MIVNYEILVTFGNNVTILGEYFETEVCIVDPLDLSVMYKTAIHVATNIFKAKKKRRSKGKKGVSCDDPERVTIRKKSHRE